MSKAKSRKKKAPNRILAFRDLEHAHNRRPEQSDVA